MIKCFLEVDKIIKDIFMLLFCQIYPSVESKAFLRLGPKADNGLRNVLYIFLVLLIVDLDLHSLTV